MAGCRKLVLYRLAIALLCTLLAGCATTAGLLGMGEERKDARSVVATVRECDADSAKTPLAKWSSLSGSLLVRQTGLPAGSGLNRKRIELATPVAVAALANTLYIADAGQRAILRFDRGTQTVALFARVPDMNMRSGLYVDRAYTVYLADPASASVTVFDIDGNPLQSYRNATGMPQPVAVASSVSGDEIFAADELASHILVYNRAGIVTRTIGSGTSTAEKFQSIAAITTGPDQLYVSDNLGHQVHALAPDGTYRYGFGKDELVSPGAVVIDDHNRVYVADNGDSTIKVYRGGQLEAIVGGRNDPVGLGFQVISSLWISDGLMYVADSGRASIDILRVVVPCD